VEFSNSTLPLVGRSIIREVLRAAFRLRLQTDPPGGAGVWRWLSREPRIGSRAGAQFGRVFPQVLLRFHGIQAHRDLAQVHEAKTVSGQKPAFIEDVDARLASQSAIRDKWPPLAHIWPTSRSTTQATGLVARRFRTSSSGAARRLNSGADTTCDSMRDSDPKTAVGGSRARPSMGGPSGPAPHALDPRRRNLCERCGGQARGGGALLAKGVRARPDEGAFSGGYDAAAGRTEGRFRSSWKFTYAAIAIRK